MTNTTAQDLLSEFETKPCGRCGGSGHHSYRSMYGTTCFQCRGRKKVYTKRAEVALAYARELRTVPAPAVQVGWLLWTEGDPMFGSYKSGWYTIESIRTDGSKYSVKVGDVETWLPYTMLETKVCSHGVTADTEVQAVANRERLAEVRKLALEYQATLNERGKVSKRSQRHAVVVA